ncbi:hypothetical protein WMY93_010412 [Mugilogobius chulae]|uniref:Calnexin n=1 Tax=Mugilogobius chulae TaxID=88201 RepID=A0AAW0PJT1_9GOBI
MIDRGDGQREPGLIESLILAANTRPWLWSVYVFSVGLPVILFISFMWPDKRFGPPDMPYYYKKSDEDEEDDPRTRPAAATQQDKSTETGARRRDVQRKSDLDLKVD